VYSLFGYFPWECTNCNEQSYIRLRKDGEERSIFLEPISILLAITVIIVAFVGVSMFSRSGSAPAAAKQAGNPATAAVAAQTPPPAVKYDGKTNLDCYANVDCQNRADVVAKMKLRWNVYAKDSENNRFCLNTIQKIENTPQSRWTVAMAINEIQACNAH
jgi:hypothetical protein